METLKLTPIDQLEDMADGVPVLAVEGTVKYAADITRSKPEAQHPWTKQFFVLGNDTASIACSMWDAEGSELAKGDSVRIENTQNKKGQWSGMTKGSYQKEEKEGNNIVTVRKHTLEIRANQVKITEEPWPDATGTSEVITTRHSMLDERQRAIIRQHSQSMAIEVLKLKQMLGEITVEDLTPSKLTSLANYFDADVLEATK